MPHVQNVYSDLFSDLLVYLLMEQCQAFIFRESMVNKPLTLPCSCSGDCPAVQWIRFIPKRAVVAESAMCLKQQHSQSRYSVSGDTSGGDFSLTIGSVAYNDAGSYMCSCNGQSVTEVKLKVLGKCACCHQQKILSLLTCL